MWYLIFGITLFLAVLAFYLTNRHPVVVDKFIVMGDHYGPGEDGDHPIVYRMSAGYFVVSQWWRTKTVPVNAATYMAAEIGDIWHGPDNLYVEYGDSIGRDNNNGGVSPGAG